MEPEFIIFLFKIIISVLASALFMSRRIDAIIDKKKAFSKQDSIRVFAAAILVFILSFCTLTAIALALMGK